MVAPAQAIEHNRDGRVHTATLLRRLLGEPLLHFFILGALLFAAGRLLQKPQFMAARTRIEVPAAEIRRMREVWTVQWQRPPRPDEMRSLIEEYVREQVLFREAVAIGLDRDDEIVRRRLIQKMEFLSQEMKPGAERPAEVERGVD